MIGPNPPSNATPAIKAVWREVHERYARSVSSAGVAVCRCIGGGTNCHNVGKTWSQHAWGNAWDITGSTATLDRVAAFLRSPAMRPFVAQVLWRVPDHYDHIHVSGRPMFVGVPACAGGTGGITVGPIQVTLEPLPQTAELIGGETWAPASRMAARELTQRASRIARIPDLLGRIIGGR